jgi:Family of unknown function (DUF6159)
MGALSRGFRLMKVSWGVVKQDRQLLWLPVISFLCSLIVMAVFALGAVGIGIPEQGESPSPALYVLLFVMYVVLSFVTVYFNAAVIGTAMKRLKGEDASIRDGLAMTRQHVGQIFVWALITATVGMILRLLQERAGLLGRIVLGVIGLAWTVITFFVVPVILFEPESATGAIKRSASIFRQRWGEQFTGQATIGVAILLIGIPVALIGGAIAAAAPVVGIPLLVIAIGVLAAIGAACTGVFNAALYRYATTGESSGAFTVEDMNSSFRPRGGLRGRNTPTAPTGFSGEGFGGSDVPPPPPAAPPSGPES